MLSACLVVYNEEKVITRCLDSIKDLVDEIIIVHDGECTDRTLEIARKYTDKIFVQPHIGEAEEHRVFALNQAKGDWILQIDADEYLDTADHGRIKQLISHHEHNGFLLRWELWDEKRTITFPGLKKLCLYKKDRFHYIGVPHDPGWVDDSAQSVDIFLHHRPTYNNANWSSVIKKTKKWAPIHAKYFFYEQMDIPVFNTTLDEWKQYAFSRRRFVYLYLFLDSAKIFIGQLKNGQLFNWDGVKFAIQAVYYRIHLLLEVAKLSKSRKGNILDLGCGKGGNYLWLGKRGVYRGVDIMSDNIKYATERYGLNKFSIYDGYRVPFESQFFSEIHCYDVLEHVIDFHSMIEEIGRLLRPGGLLYITVPAGVSEKILRTIKPNYFEEVGHLRVVAPEELVGHLTKQGVYLVKKARVRGMETIILSLVFLFHRKKVLDFQTGSLLLNKFIPALIWLFDARLFQTKLKYLFPIYIFTLPIGWLVSKILPKSLYFVFKKNDS